MLSGEERQVAVAGAAGLAIMALAVAALALFRPAGIVDFRVLDGLFARARAESPRPLGERVVVVGIDLASVKSIEEPMSLWHAHLGRFLEGLREAKPAVVAVDLVLPDRSYESVAPGLDAALIRGLVLSRSSFPTVLAQTVDEGGRHRYIYPAFVTAAGVEPGYALWPMDSDGVVRRFDEHLGQAGERVPTLVGQVARLLGKEPQAGYVDFASGSALGYVPFREVLERMRQGDETWLRSQFGGKAVFLGTVMPLLDSVRLPAALASWGPPAEATPGVLLQAHTARAILADRILAPAPAWGVALLAVLATLVAGASARPVRGTVLAAGVLVALFLAARALLGAGHVLPVFAIAAGAVGGWAVRQGLGVFFRLLERYRLRQSFSGYVSPAVMGEILKGNLSPGVQGEQRYVCLMFSDIRGYTTRSEGMNPAELLDFLNRYFDGVVAIIHEHGGAVVSFMGDGVMAVFGAPEPLENPCESAYRASRAMLENLRRVNGRLASEGRAAIDIGIGLNAGEAVLGHVGGKDRHDYSVIGDVTNVASRLESSSKSEGYRLIVSGEVARHLPDRTGLVALGPVSLKGHTPVEAHGFDPLDAPDESVR